MPFLLRVATRYSITVVSQLRKRQTLGDRSSAKKTLQGHSGWSEKGTLRKEVPGSWTVTESVAETPWKSNFHRIAEVR